MYLQHWYRYSWYFCSVKMRRVSSFPWVARGPLGSSPGVRGPQVETPWPTSYGLLLQQRPTASRFLSGCFSVTPTPSGVLGGIRGYTPYTNLQVFWQRILTSVIINKQGTFRPFSTALCVYPPPFLAIHHWCHLWHLGGGHGPLAPLNPPLIDALQWLVRLYERRV